MKTEIKSTTIIGVRHKKKVAIAGDGQVTFGDMAFKQKAVKVRQFNSDKGSVLGGFAGAAADALTLFEKFEQKLEQYDGELKRAVVELAKDVDYLVCICSGLQSDIEGTPEDDYMSGSIDAGMMAKEANVSNLMLVHEGYNLSDPINLQSAIDGIKEIYDGNIIQTNELKTYYL